MKKPTEIDFVVLALPCISLDNIQITGLIKIMIRLHEI